MRSVLTVVTNEGLLNRIKLIFNDESIKYYYSTDCSEVADIASDNEIAVAVIEYSQGAVSGEEICEMLDSINSEIQTIIIFDEKETADVISLYNRLHISKLMCKQNLVLEDLPSLIEKCFHIYNRDEEIDALDKELKLLNDKYMKPMQEMSSLLNERLSGYSSLIKVFKKNLQFVINPSEKALKCVDVFVDRVLNDFVQIYMVKEPDVSIYFGRIRDNFNSPDDKKYFKFINDGVDEELLLGETKYNLLFLLDVITIGFDVFYPFYRGKVTVSDANDKIEINALYDVRKDSEIEQVYSYILASICNILSTYSYETRFGEKENLIQFKSVLLGC